MRQGSHSRDRQSATPPPRHGERHNTQTSVTRHERQHSATPPPRHGSPHPHAIASAAYQERHTPSQAAWVHSAKRAYGKVTTHYHRARGVKSQLGLFVCVFLYMLKKWIWGWVGGVDQYNFFSDFFISFNVAQWEYLTIKRLTNVVFMLGQSRRRWANIKSTLVKCLVFSGHAWKQSALIGVLNGHGETITCSSDCLPNAGPTASICGPMMWEHSTVL